MLASWSALWHPRLMAAAGGTMRWYRADFPPDDLSGRIVVIPEVSERVLLSGWLERTQEQQARLIRGPLNRDEILRQALAWVDDDVPEVDPEVVSDFLALGFAHLSLELLTRQMRYISNLDEVHFESQAMAAAKAAVAGDAEQTQDCLRNTFDVLMEGRERFYPVDAYLLDLTLVAPSTMGASLRRELAQSTPGNVMISASTVERMARDEPTTLEELKAAIGGCSVSLVGGEYAESPLPLMSAEEIRAELVRGAAVYDRLLGTHPKVFGRRTAGLVASLPQILARSGYLGAIHATFDEGRLPRSGQGKARWQGWDHTSLDAYTRTPLDAREPGTFLGLAVKLGETMDLDHVATLAFAHWPGDTSPWYDDLRRVHNFVPLFGKFVTVEEYFGQTDTAGGYTKLTTDDYQTPYLAQAVRAGEGDPISRFQRSARRDGERLAASGVKLMQAALTGAVSNLESGTADALASVLARGGDPSQTGTLVINPCSFARTTAVEFTSTGGARSWRSVDVAPMGFAWVDPSSAPTPIAKKKPPRPLAQDLSLANEHFEIGIHPETGGIGKLLDYRTRRNRLSQQLAFRFGTLQARSAAEHDAEYSSMQADSIEVTISDPAVGEIVSRGRLVGADNRLLARFEQAVRVVRGSRLAELTLRLDIVELPEGDPWQSYYCSRFAWSDEAADLRRSITGTSQPTDAKRLEAPHFVEIRDEKARTAILTGGLAFHRRSGARMLDTLLITQGELQREFRLGIGVDLSHAEPAALDLIGPSPIVAHDVPCPRGHQSGWLFRIEIAHAVATHWEPLLAPATETGSSGKVIGFRVRIQETEGKPGRGRLESFRPIRAARQVDLLGQPLIELRLVDDAVMLDIGAYEWLEIEAEWRE